MTTIAKIGATVVALGLLVSGIFVADKQITNLEQRVEVLQNKASAEFGAYNPVGSGFHYLAGSGITSGATSITLDSLQTRDGREITMTNFGEIGYATIEPGSSSKLEFISFTGITQSGLSDQATLTGVSRGLDPLYPYNASSSLAYSHSGGSLVIFSNSPAFYDEIVFERNDSSITGTYTFSSSSPPRYDTSNYSFITGESWLANKAYVDNVAVSGAADASGDTKGLVEIPTRSEVANGATVGSGDTSAYMCLPSDYASTSSSATTTIPITGTDGKLAQGFLDLTENWLFSGNVTISGNTTTTGEWISTGLNYLQGTTTMSNAFDFSTDIPTIPTTTPIADDEVVSKKYADDTFVNISTTTEISASRSIGTDYQNTSDGYMFVSASISISIGDTNDGGATFEGVIGVSTSTYATTTRISYYHYGASSGDSGSSVHNLFMMVPPNYYYKIQKSSESGTVGVGLIYWTESY